VTTRWNSQWEIESKNNYWLEPDNKVIELANSLNKKKKKDVLDLGCGIGRHTFCLVKEGFNVTALDSSPNALYLLRQKLSALGLCANLIEGDYSRDLFKVESFDFILAFNVIYPWLPEEFTGLD
jgi:2-polyprenyl-3-methyl-5-hydroxy-6-metoxy-1,4-benzoquinol methylase